LANNTLSVYTTTGIQLATTGAYQTPFTITQTGTVNVTHGDAVYSNLAGAYLLNEGGIFSPSSGVVFENGGTLINAATATISSQTGVLLTSAGDLAIGGSAVQSLANAGLITGSGNGVVIQGSSSNVDNTGTIYGSGDALYFIGGGSITNAGTLAGAYGAHLADEPGTALTFTNTGTVLATSRGVLATGDGNQTITNANFLSGDFMGIELANKGVAMDTVINTGTIETQSFGIFAYTLGNVAVFNTGLIEGGGTGVQLDNSGNGANTLINTGTIANNFSGVYLDVKTSGGVQTLINHGFISGDYGVALRVTAAIGTTIENSGTIASTRGAAGYAIGTLNSDDSPFKLIVDPGAAFIGKVTGSGGVLEFAAGTGSLSGIGDQFFDFATFALDAGASWTVSGVLDSSADEVVTGFTSHDMIDITNLTPSESEVTLSGPDVLVLTQGPNTLTLDFVGDSGTVLTLTSDGAGGTFIEEVTCFLRGTRIATARGQIRVEDLAIGDALLTLHAGTQKVKWIGTRRYAAPFCNHAKVLPIHIRAHAIAENVPLRDLFVSPGHAICIDDALIHAARLVNGVTITQLERAELVEYFHIELENHEVIFAENCPAETFMGEYFRQQFQNAESFSTLYPGSQAPEIFSVPFLSSGFQLGAILRRLRARAGITAPATPGPLCGFVDAITPSIISGWALDLAAPDEPVLLDILADGQRLGRALANIPRPDVAAAGFGRGDHGFEFALPAGTIGPITVRRAADGAALARAIHAQAA
jgi:hypothetical protein